MGFHLVLVAKLKLLSAGHHMCLSTPIMASLVGPFLIKFIFTTFKPLHQVFINAAYASRLFIFQMGQITFSSQPPGFTNGANTRWQRALRLVSERLILARQSQTTDSEEESIRAISALAL
ncbi:unnamed protein product [Coffea canephora]|uniref:Uncharacterized protein n=1 Tax=Coffea canephora TaxID=49390 RepID=A0A068UNR8_COFCA|nr:unnamed protein product [Coffea canephora]